MKLKTFLLATLIAAGSLRAQVGIGAKSPESQLDVKGNVKIGFEENNPGKKGMLRWSDAKTCMESQNPITERAGNLDYTKSFDEKPLVNLTGGGMC